MRAVVTLTPSESKRLIAKAVVRMPEVRKAWENAYLLLSDGTTNAFIAQELSLIHIYIKVSDGGEVVCINMKELYIGLI